MPAMQGKICVVTGATSGIGLVTAETLAAKQARVVIVGRDAAKADTAIARIVRRFPAATVEARIADLSQLAKVHRLADELALLPRIDVLINNAGAMFWHQQNTPDGLERTFALNHMAYFVLSLRLRDRIADAAPARIVNVASEAHRGETLDWDDLQCRRKYRGWVAYGRSKLCNILFTRALARRLQGTGITVNCLHPGFVASRFGDESGGPLSIAVGIGKRLFAITPEQGAQTSIHLASAPEVEGRTGLYFIRSAPAAPSQAAQDDAAAERLWQESARIAGLSV
jgi:NAD(P)-dependent dehydrogenase (short-subunit alcohol dehydrogenase family)